MSAHPVFRSPKLQQNLKDILESAPSVVVPETRQDLLDLATGGGQDRFQVSYVIPGTTTNYVEAEVVKAKNGVAINFTDIYMRRRDPDCMTVADRGETDKPRYRDRFGESFKELRRMTFKWLAEQDLIFLPFMAGGHDLGYPALLVAPKNAGFFAGGLADLQGFIPASQVPDDFVPRAVVYLAPPFRHTHFEEKQAVIHNRTDVHEVFSYNLYPGPSAKKGIYGVLLTIGESEGWITAHGSTVRLITPYDNVFTIMHEGASGGGKSEMLEQIHRQPDGRVLLGENVVTGVKHYLELNQTCELEPVTDDMALCHPKLQKDHKHLIVVDAEEGWFLRVNHINHYGTDPHYERLTVQPKEPLIFLNIDAVPNSTALIWEHIMDKPGQPCPNPRVIMPRHLVPGVVNEPEGVSVDVRSFGIRTPPATADHPTYGIVGLLHVLPPALAWLWRLVAPRGHDNPSVTDTSGMQSEGVGSYWPFATGRVVDQANLLLQQIVSTPKTRYVLIPNQHIGAWKVGFMPEWIGREYLARRGSARFREDLLVEARCSLLGYALNSVRVDGVQISREFLQVNTQSEVGNAAYDEGAKILQAFFKRELKKFLDPDLLPLGREIIEAALNDADVEKYSQLISAN